MLSSHQRHAWGLGPYYRPMGNRSATPPGYLSVNSSDPWNRVL